VRNPWVRRLLKILLVYAVACVPDMWKLVSIGPPVSIASAVLILVTSLTAPPVYLFRLAAGEPSYLAAVAPFALLFAVGAIVVYVTERKRDVQD